MSGTPRTLFDKVWDAHVVQAGKGGVGHRVEKPRDERDEEDDEHGSALVPERSQELG